MVDLIRGNPVFELRTLEDFVVLRGNGTPMFLLANVVDDIDMGITHVIRGEEHLPNTPKAQLLWEALDGGPLPTWAHVPVLVNDKRQKLSKRRDKVALEEYRDEGYLADGHAQLPHAARLVAEGRRRDRAVVARSWSEFRLDDVVPSPAFFDVKKLTAFNSDYIRMLTVDEFVAAAEPWVAGLAPAARDAFVALAPLVQERVKVLSEVPSYVEFFDAVPDVPDDFAKATKEPVGPGGARRGDRGLRERRLEGRRPQGRASPASPRPTA